MIDIAPVNRELLEAITAAGRGRRARRRELLARLAARAPPAHGVHARARRGARWPRARRGAFVGLGFTAVYREGFETVLFYQALVAVRRGPRALGLRSARSPRRSRSAASATRSSGWASKLPLKPMLIGGASILLLLLSVAFAGNAVRSLQSADLVRATPVQPAGRGCRCSSPS